MEYNLKVRELRCKLCKITIQSDQPNVMCELCGRPLLTVVRNSDGVIVENVELAEHDRQRTLRA